MTPTTTILLRHGQTALSAEKRFAGVVDVALTDTGAALDELLAAQPGRTVLIVSHLTPVKEIVARALLAPSPEALLRMQLDVAALCEIDWYPDGAASLRSFNDTAHLRDT